MAGQCTCKYARQRPLAMKVESIPPLLVHQFLPCLYLPVAAAMPRGVRPSGRARCIAKAKHAP
eukprot:6191860-Pleurochrysis_carterae.AAC.4